MHLYSSYGDEFSDQVLSDDAGQLITECLAFLLGEPRLYGVGKAIRVGKPPTAWLSDDEADDGLEAVR